MRVGGAEVCITPPHPIAMGGYGARSERSLGTHDDLYVRCAYIEGDNGPPSVLLTYDLVVVPEALVAQVQQRLADEFSVLPERVVLHATHTHSGPDVGLTFGTKADDRMPTYTEMLVAWSASACLMAKQRCESVSLVDATTLLAGVGGVRRNGSKSMLPLRTLGFVTHDERIALAMVTFPCHPTVMGADNRCVSADYPGECIQTVKDLLGPETVVVFLNGAAGDISTRFTRKAQSFDEVRRFGTALGGAAASLLLTGQTKPVCDLSVYRESVTIPPQSQEVDDVLSALEQAAYAALNGLSCPAERRIYETQLQGITYARKQAERHIQALEASITVWTFDDQAGLIFWPGEPFFGYDTQLKQALGESVTLIGYTDGMIGYIPDVTYHEDASYEVLMSLCGKAGGGHLVRESIKLAEKTALCDHAQSKPKGRAAE